MQAEHPWNLSSSATGGAREFQGTKMFSASTMFSRKRTVVVRGGGDEGWGGGGAYGLKYRKIKFSVNFPASVNLTR